MTSTVAGVLEWTSCDGEAKRLVLDTAVKSLYKIGRSRTCDVLVNYLEISRQHAEIRLRVVQTGTTSLVRAVVYVNSPCNMYVNGVLAEKGSHRKLKGGERLNLAGHLLPKTEITFSLPSAEMISESEANALARAQILAENPEAADVIEEPSLTPIPVLSVDDLNGYLQEPVLQPENEIANDPTSQQSSPDTMPSDSVPPFLEQPSSSATTDYALTTVPARPSTSQTDQPSTSRTDQPSTSRTDQPATSRTDQPSTSQTAHQTTSQADRPTSSSAVPVSDMSAFYAYFSGATHPSNTVADQPMEVDSESDDESLPPISRFGPPSPSGYRRGQSFQLRIERILMDEIGRNSTQEQNQQSSSNQPEPADVPSSSGTSRSRRRTASRDPFEEISPRRARMITLDDIVPTPRYDHLGRPMHFALAEQHMPAPAIVAEAPAVVLLSDDDDEATSDVPFADREEIVGQLLDESKPVESVIVLTDDVEKEDDNVSKKCDTGVKMDEKILSCAICLEIFFNVANTSPCNHKFCYSCILQWRDGNKTCPSCRVQIKSIAKDSLMESVVECYMAAYPEKRRAAVDREAMLKREEEYSKKRPRIDGGDGDFFTFGSSPLHLARHLSAMRDSRMGARVEDPTANLNNERQRLDRYRALREEHAAAMRRFGDVRREDEPGPSGTSGSNNNLNNMPNQFLGASPFFGSMNRGPTVYSHPLSSIMRRREDGAGSSGSNSAAPTATLSNAQRAAEAEYVAMRTRSRFPRLNMAARLEASRVSAEHRRVMRLPSPPSEPFVANNNNLDPFGFLGEQQLMDAQFPFGH